MKPEEIAWRLQNFGKPRRIDMPKGYEAWSSHFEWVYQEACKAYGFELEPVIVEQGTLKFE